MASNGFTICLSNPMEIKGPLIWWILFGCQNIRVSSLEQMAAIKCLILFLCIHRCMSIMTTCSQMIGEREDLALSPLLRSLAHQMKYVSQSKPINSPLAVEEVLITLSVHLQSFFRLLYPIAATIHVYRAEEGILINLPGNML